MITIDIDDGGISDALNRLIALSEDLDPVLKVIGETLAASTKQRFSAETAPDGTAWQPNAPSTLAKKGAGKKMLQGETGLLRSSIVAQVLNQELTVGSPMEYSAIQQLGGYAGRAAGKAGPIQRPYIPARPFLGLSDEDQGEIDAILRDAIQNAVKNA